MKRRAAAEVPLVTPILLPAPEHLHHAIVVLGLLERAANRKPDCRRASATDDELCNGLIEGACTKMVGCQWVKNTSPKDKQGRPLTDHCRPKAISQAAKK
jgi:hypothetical protein